MQKTFQDISYILHIGVYYFYKLSFSHLQHVKSHRLFTKKNNFFKLIIARYNECVKWSNIYSGIRIIFNKGEHFDDKILTPEDVYIKLPNKGRESHTFLHYIIEYYITTKQIFNYFTKN